MMISLDFMDSKLAILIDGTNIPPVYIKKLKRKTYRRLKRSNLPRW